MVFGSYAHAVYPRGLFFTFKLLQDRRASVLRG